MFPLLIKDLPAEAWDLIEALGLVPVKLTNDYEPELFWSVFTDCDCLRDDSFRYTLGNSGWESLAFPVLSSNKCPVLPLRAFRPFLSVKFDNDTYFQYSIQWPTA